MYKNLTTTSVLGMLAIVLGAFGAHALKSKLSPEAISSFGTAVRYQIIHVLLLLVINLSNEFLLKQKNKLTLVFVVGIFLFSGSIYAIHLLNIPAKSIWFVTPIGGLVLIIGWAMLSYHFLIKHKRC